MAVTIEELTNWTRAESADAKAVAILTRLLAVAESRVERFAPDAPDAEADAATLVYASYMYDRLPASRFTGYADAFRNSGAEVMLGDFHILAAQIVGEALGA